MFMPDQGTARCDFPEGSIEMLWNSMQKILALPEETVIYCCHDYAPGGRKLKWITTVGDEKKGNIHVKEGTTKEEFSKFRSSRDATLPQPKLIIPSIQMNIRAGKIPPVEDNGIAYLKVPLNTFK